MSRAELYIRHQKSTAQGAVVQDKWMEIEEHYRKKLWHQLTQLIFDCLRTGVLGHVNMKELYDNFIQDFERHIAPLYLSMISVLVAHDIYNTDPQAAFDFLEARERPCEKSKEAIVRLHTGVIQLKLKRMTNVKEVQNLLEKTQEELDAIAGVTPVHAPFFKVSALFRKETKDYAGYYREALRYLGCGTVDDLEDDEKLEQAVLLGFAALLGNDVYNFGELLTHPIFEVLQQSDYRWLYDVVLAFNSGDVQKFNNLEPSWGQWPDLKGNEEFIRDKIRLLCVMELALTRPSKGRVLPFDVIAEKTQVPLKEVEFVVMRAMSKNLITGTINEPAKVVNISQVQPRVLDSNQIRAMAERISKWKGQVDVMGAVFKENAQEILTRT
ncbi:hypothetical protein QR680_000636 [Steinernema hermaphroditum]|uniref:26S proteasome non-ATPase regulatory subunit 13 n=1 Tax=Steinernema hermaphroditum TaxID=289476 RepID=A0AA39GWT6_9BILA|nr:hypothetical protein QR680_000636 [Steinernema hermaphroditum]